MKSNLHPYSPPLILLFSNGSLVFDRFFLVQYFHLFSSFYSLTEPSSPYLLNLRLDTLRQNPLYRRLSLRLSSDLSITPVSPNPIQGLISQQHQSCSSLLLSFFFPHFLSRIHLFPSLFNVRTHHPLFSNTPSFLVFDLDTFIHSFWSSSFSSNSSSRFSDDALSKFQKRFSSTLSR